MARSEGGRRDAASVVDELAAANRAYRDVEERIESVGETTVERVASVLDDAEALLNRYEGRATGTGGEEFREFVKMQAEIEAFVEDLDDDLRHRDALEAVEAALDKRRLSESDFRRAREALAPARETAKLLDERASARERCRDARRAVRDRLETVRDEIADREQIRRYGDTDLDASVERLREPIEAHNDAAREAFREFRRSAPAREVLAWVRTTEEYPLVDYRQPPSDLRRYVEGADAGEEPIPTLLEYADYSRSKLAHYVEDPAELKRRVATERTYLERLSADPLTVAWPPPPAGELRHRGREIVAVLGRFADDPVVERARAVRRLVFDDDYERLRDAAVARDRLRDEDRQKLANGELAAELEDLRATAEELERALEEFPRR